jgi:hypothetical protein
MVHRTSSPLWSHSPRDQPMPGGVPVMITVPGGSVVPVEIYATILGTQRVCVATFNLLRHVPDHVLRST